MDGPEDEGEGDVGCGACPGVGDAVAELYIMRW